MSQLSVTLHQKVGDAVSVVPCGDGFMISLGRRTAEGMVVAVLPQAQVALLLSKLTTAFMMSEAPPCPVLDGGVVKAGDAGLGVLAKLRANLTAQGADLTPPSDDFGPLDENSLGSPSLSVALSKIGPGATRDQILTALGYEPLGDEPVTTADVEAFCDIAAKIGAEFSANVVRFPRGAR